MQNFIKNLLIRGFIWVIFGLFFFWGGGGSLFCCFFCFFLGLFFVGINTVELFP